MTVEVFAAPITETQPKGLPREEGHPRILNLTQHTATEDQRKEGVIEPTDTDKVVIKQLLTFDDIPTVDELKRRAKELAEIASNRYDVRYAMIGGAPYFMRFLEDALLRKGVEPVYAFSRREAIEVSNPDGTVVKKMVFRHIGFVRPFNINK